jgi:hypothetical protein
VSSDSGIVTAWQPSFSLVRGPFSCLRHYIVQNPSVNPGSAHPHPRRWSTKLSLLPHSIRHRSPRPSTFPPSAGHHPDRCPNNYCRTLTADLRFPC